MQGLYVPTCLKSHNKLFPPHSQLFCYLRDSRIAIKRFLRDDGIIKVSRSLKELSYKAYLCQERLCDKWGRDPTVSEIAEELGVDR